MPTVEVEGATLFCEEAGGSHAETVVLAHGLLLDHRVFAAQIEAASRKYRVLAYDQRCHGRSGSSAGRDLGVDQLFADAVELIETRVAGRCHFVGSAAGALVGLRLAARRPDLLRSCVLIGATAEAEGPRGWRSLGLPSRLLGIRPVEQDMLHLLFGRSFLLDPAKAETVSLWRGRLRELDARTIAAALRGMLGREGIEGELCHIQVPMLLLVGEEDETAPPDHAEAIHAAVGGSMLVRVPRAGHSPSIEQPEVVTREVLQMLDGIG